MSKEEKIKEAYGDLFQECKPNENGWCNVTRFPLDKNIDLWDGNWIKSGTNYKPKSLQGIEDNNGWIKIESESDLPTKDVEYYLGKFNKDGVFSQSKNNYNLMQAKYALKQKHFTHCQLIGIKQPPIY